jgi:hypothetical protein
MITELDIPYIELNDAITFSALSHIEFRPFMLKFNVMFDNYYLTDYVGHDTTTRFIAFSNDITAIHCDMINEYCKRKMGLYGL